MESGLVLITI